jgi:predicted  nucleic acid-binding Zn-ribbon protein
MNFDPLEFVSVTLAFLALVVGVTVWIVSRIAALSERHVTESGKLRLDITSHLDVALKNLQVEIDDMRSDEAKRRQELATITQNASVQMQRQINQLRDASATKPELQATEGRLTSAMVDVKNQVSKISDKLDIIPEIRAELGALARQVREAVGHKP